MYDRHASSRRTDYELARPAPRAVTSLVAALLVVVVVTATLAVPAVVVALVLATPVAVRLAVTIRRHEPRAVARRAALRVEPLLSAALQR